MATESVRVTFLNEISAIVKTSAPLLASALGSPVAGIALSLISSAFGLSQDASADEVFEKIKASPDSKLKLKQIEFDHYESLKKIESSDFQAVISDKKDAREKSLQYKAFIMLLAFFVTVGFFSAIYLCLLAKVNLAEPEKQILLVFVGVLTSKWQTIIDFFFGSSNK